MNNLVEVIVLVEGPTESRFVKQILAPYMAEKGIYLTPVVLDKPGESGGDVKFARAKNDIERHLKQRPNTFVTLLVDYYGIRNDWPGYAESKQQTLHTQKSEVMNQKTAKEVERLFSELSPNRRFIPYVSMHETEALYFSDPACLAEKLGVNQSRVDAILSECGEPEQINNHYETKPSKRLEELSSRFKKTTTGISIATEIGIPKMREACPLFNNWVTTLEQLVERT